MNENLEKRKKQLLETLKEEYAEKPRRWWQGKSPEYETTWEAGNQSNHRQTSDETIIRYDLKGALKGSALFFVITFGMYVVPDVKNDGPHAGVVFMLVMMALVIGLPILKEIKRPPKIIMNQQGIWVHSIEEFILWNDLTASFIKKEEDGDSTNYYLVLHYYLEKYDSFAVTEYKLGNLDMKTEDLALEIECWKMKKRCSDL